jgi:4-hydroxy-tetrahydrodipicolinate reductase
MTKIGIVGCSGRMGRMLLAEAYNNQDVTLTGGTSRSQEGNDIGTLINEDNLGISVSNNIESLVQKSDAIIEFTTPELTLKIADLCAKYHKIHVSGTTGLTDAERNKLAEYAKNTKIIWSTNMSIGVNLLNSLVEKVAKTLDLTYDIEIVEMHHNKKVDAPSGTALTLGEYAAKGRNVVLNDVASRSRDGIIGARPQGEIGFATLRGGDVIGDHTVIFAGQGERIEISHKASNRTIYAKGAVKACIWAKNKPNGLYSMADVLDI